VQFAKLVGVCPGSIFVWESVRTVPRGGSRARLIQLGKAPRHRKSRARGAATRLRRRRSRA
jgi:hypothetical protein